MAEQLEQHTQQPTVVVTNQGQEHFATEQSEHTHAQSTDATTDDSAAVQLANEIVTKIVDESIKNASSALPDTCVDDILHDVAIAVPEPKPADSSLEPNSSSDNDSDASASVSVVSPAPSTPTKPHSGSTLNRRCGCECECWKRDDYPGLAPRKAGYKERTNGEAYVVIMACKHFASCHLSGTTCASE